MTPEDYLFRSYAIGFTNPRRGLPEVDEAWGRRRSVLAQVFRADILMGLADETGRVEDAEAARDALRGVRAFMGDSPTVAYMGLYIHCIGCNNCRLHDRPEEAKQWLTDGLEDFRKAGTEACRDHPAALQGRTIYVWLRDRSTESLDAENMEAGRKGVYTSACVAYLASLFRRGKDDDAMDYLRTVRNNQPDVFTLPRAAFLVGAGTRPPPGPSATRP